VIGQIKRVRHRGVNTEIEKEREEERERYSGQNKKKKMGGCKAAYDPFPPLPRRQSSCP